jgi:diaminopropionate ammonia-lyase
MFLRPQARDLRGGLPPPRQEPEVRAFHARLPGYAPTPLTEVPALAAELGVGRVLVKDESSRLGLPAFKILGASWAIARLLTSRAGRRGRPGLARDAITLAGLRAAVPPGLAFAAATDGNHGRAVARMAALLGARSEIFVPDVVDQAAADLIASEGAVVRRVAGDYDEAVRRAAKCAAATGAELVQDTSWDGYAQVPGWIVDGYGTLPAEIDDLADPDLVVVPAGVGALAQAIVTHYRGRRAHVVTAEPDTADCVRRSLLAGRPVTVSTGRTAMAGLNCPTPSALAWPSLRNGLSGAIAVSEEQAASAASDLAARGIPAGPCGAATLAAVRQLPLARLGLGRAATIVLLSTEGARP